MHLTGVITKLSAYEFYEKCLNGSIKEKDFETAVEGCPQVKGYIRLKMRNLIHISSFFNAKIFVQERFKRNVISCLIATSDGKCTLGFADAKYVARPITLLDKNHLDSNKPIISLKPKVVKFK